MPIPATWRHALAIFLKILDKHGPAVVALVGVLLWFIAADANWIHSSSKANSTMLWEQRQALAELTRTTDRLAVAMEGLVTEQRRQNATMRELWCYGVVRDREILRQCLAGVQDTIP